MDDESRAEAVPTSANVCVNALYGVSHRTPSVPRTKTSNTPLAGDVAAGDEVRDPPRDFQLDQEPVHVF